MLFIDLEGMAAEALGVRAGGEPLDGDVLWYQYRTQRDLRVRPSHAALEGTVWRADDPMAPTPPIAYGCRCYLVPIAAPGGPLDQGNLWPSTDKQPVTIAAAFAKHLESIIPAWGEIVARLKKMPVAARADAAYAAVQVAEPKMLAADARDVANMICVVANG